MTGTLVIARLAWRRLWRGRSIWVSGLLALMAVGFAGLTFDHGPSPEAEWEATAQFLLRLPLMVSAILHLAPAVGEEVESQTISYLWSRPIARPALLAGKLLAVAPAIALLFGIAAGVSWLILQPEDSFASLLRVELGVAVGTFAISALAAGVGATFPRQPFIAVLGYVVVIEQVVSLIPSMDNVRNVSMAHHVIAIAGLRGPADPARSAIWLAALAGGWLAIGLWRVRVAEYIRADQ